MVAHLNGVQGVAGSNPVSPTISNNKQTNLPILPAGFLRKSPLLEKLISLETSPLLSDANYKTVVKSKIMLGYMAAAGKSCELASY